MSQHRCAAGCLAEPCSGRFCPTCALFVACGAWCLFPWKGSLHFVLLVVVSLASAVQFFAADLAKLALVVPLSFAAIDSCAPAWSCCLQVVPLRSLGVFAGVLVWGTCIGVCVCCAVCGICFLQSPLDLICARETDTMSNKKKCSELVSF